MPADGCYKRKRNDDEKQPYFIFNLKKVPLFFAAIGRAPYGQKHGHEGLVIVTSASNKGMVDIHDLRPLVLTADAVREWLSAETTPELVLCFRRLIFLFFPFPLSFE